MEQNKIPDLLIVSILDESGRNLDFIPSLINSFSNSQNHIFFYDHFDETTHLTIRIGDKDFDGPYQTNGSESYISMSFFNRHSITTPKQYYFLYFVRILILEFLYKEISGKTIKLFQKSSFPKLNELIWMSILPQYAQTTIQNLSHHSDENVRQIVQESHSIVRDIGYAYSLLLNRARQVGGILAEKALPGLSNPHDLLTYIFIYSNQEKVKEVTQAINNENEKGLFQLIDLLADRPHSNAMDLLKGLSAARNLDSKVKDYAMKALQAKDTVKGTQTSEDTRQTVKGGHVEVGTKVDSVPAELRVRNSELGPFREKLFSEVHGYLGDNPREIFWPAWKAVLAAEPRVSEQMELALLSEGYTHLLAFVLTLEQTKNLDVIPFLDMISSEEVADDNIREIAKGVLEQIESDPEWPKHYVKADFPTPIEHGLKEDKTVEEKSEAIGIAPPAGVTEHKRPKDALGYKVFANALGDLVSHKSTTTPLTIGICARWGRGKSVLLNYIEDRIGELTGAEKFVDCLCIDFNAWKYTKSEQLWAEFYTKVLEEVENDLSWWEKTKFRRYFFSRNNPKLYYSTFWGTGLTVYSLFLLWYFYQQPVVLQFALKIQWGELISYWTPIGTFLVTTFPFIWKRARSVPKQIFWKSHLPKFKEALGVQHEIFKSFEIVCDWLGMPGKKRIVVFIDDIDRCQPDEILQVIESIKLLLDSENFVFILAMDPKIVRLAIGESYEFISKKKSVKERLGRYYLEKIIQIPFHLPQLTYTELSRLKNQLFAVSESPDAFEGGGVAPQKTKDDTVVVQADQEAENVKEADDKSSLHESPDISPSGDDDEKEISKSEPFDKRLSVEFSKTESSDIDLLLKDNYVISPRLLNRLKNTYLLAKHFYISEHNSDPPSELIKLLAFSIKYPFESVDIFETMEYESKNKDWDSIANACKKQNDNEFDSNIDKMISMLKKHVPDIDVARKLSKYVNYFNITAS